MNIWGWAILGLFCTGAILGLVLLVQGLTATDIEDDFNERERF